MMTFDDVYKFLNLASDSRFDSSLHTPQTRTIVRNALPYLKIIGINISMTGRPVVRGVKSMEYEVKDSKGNTIFTHNSVKNHSGQLAANLLQCFIDGGEPKFIRRDNRN